MRAGYALQKVLETTRKYHGVKVSIYISRTVHLRFTLKLTWYGTSSRPHALSPRYCRGCLRQYLDGSLGTYAGVIESRIDRSSGIGIQEQVALAIAIQSSCGYHHDALALLFTTPGQQSEAPGLFS
jgi:hypothetical protein